MNMTSRSHLSVFVGAYTHDLGFVKGKASGIALYDLDQVTGKMTKRAETVADNPSFLAFHPSGKYLYTVNESTQFGSPPDNAISAFSMDSDGSLHLRNQQASLGEAPCFVTIEPGGSFALTANYNGGNFVVYPIRANGELGPASHQMKHSAGERLPHAHSINLAPGGKFALGCDLGVDRVFVYDLDLTSGRLVLQNEVALPPGSGPRHLDFHPTGQYVYVINELGGTLTVFAWDGEKGVLDEIQTLSTLPSGYSGKVSCADVHVHPNGRFVYGSNRGHDSIAIFAVDGDSGRLTLLGHESTRGKTPRNFAISPAGDLLLAANQDSDSVIVFRLDPDTGELAFLAANEIPTPVCLKVRA